MNGAADTGRFGTDPSWRVERLAQQIGSEARYKSLDRPGECSPGLSSFYRWYLAN